MKEERRKDWNMEVETVMEWKNDYENGKGEVEEV